MKTRENKGVNEWNGMEVKDIYMRENENVMG